MTAMTNAQRQARHRQKWKSMGLPSYKPVGSNMRPFVGVDGEGGGTDEQGRQLYKLLRIGDRELYNDDERLTTLQCLEFICQAPKDKILVGYGFDYDATMILRDLDEERLRMLLTPHDKREEIYDQEYKLVFYGPYAIDYLKRKYLRVGRVDRNAEEGEKACIPGSFRTIYEVVGFFQSPFVKALERFGIATDEERRQMAADKDKRSGFDVMTQDIRDYNARECEWLAELMEAFRDVVPENMRPRTWNGAGAMAQAMHKTHGTPMIKELAVPEDVLRTASAAYYGGRFELTATGHIPGSIFEHDIRSAYPDAMRSLPCLIHGKWERLRPNKLLPADAVYVAECAYSHPPGTPVCGLPHRTKEHRLRWQRLGQGVYWSREIEAARAIGARVKVGAGWRYVRRCDCRPFAWVEDAYAARLKAGSATEGYPLKLAINSLYGKLAQHVGRAPYRNPVWAGLITAMTRAKLLHAIAPDPSAALYLATDAVYATVRLDLKAGVQLGEWDVQEHADGGFFVQPGLYWGPPKPKTRGMPGRLFNGEVRARFEAEWQKYAEAAQAALRPAGIVAPTLELAVPSFVGLGLALARGKPETAGTWRRGDGGENDPPRRISFDWGLKRQGAEWHGSYVRHAPHTGRRDDVSAPHSEAPAPITADAGDFALEQFYTTADHLDFNAPGFNG